MQSLELMNFLASLLLLTNAQSPPSDVKWHISSLDLSTCSDSTTKGCDFSFTVNGNSIPKYPGFQAKCKGTMSKDEKEWKACDIETASDTLRAGGESAVKSVENWLKVDGEMGTVSVRVKFGVGDKKEEVWKASKVAKIEEFKGMRRGFDADARLA